MINQKELKELLHYDPEIGVFTWIKRNSNRIKIGDTAGNIHCSGYREIKVCKKQIKAHRLAFLYMTGILPNIEVDHINGLRDDNRWINLRLVTKSENLLNKKVYCNNESGMAGVHRSSNCNSWNVQIKKNNVNFLRSFADRKFGGKDLALMAASFFVVNKRVELGFHENHGRAL